MTDRVEELGALRGDASSHMTPVIPIALSRDELCFLEPVEQPRNVRNLGDHALSDLSAAEPILPRAPEDPQDVELGARETEWPQRLIGCVVYDRRRPQEPE